MEYHEALIIGPDVVVGGFTKYFTVRIIIFTLGF